MTVRIYGLDNDYEIHKKRNKDLSLFISCLINRKERGAAVTCKDLADFQIPDLAGDIDVWIANTFTAIECKLRMQDSKSTDDQLENFSKEVERDLKKHVKVGARNLITVTNLDDGDAQNLHKLLIKSFSDIPVRVISKSISDLLQMISEITEALKGLREPFQ